MAPSYPIVVAPSLFLTSALALCGCSGEESQPAPAQAPAGLPHALEVGYERADSGPPITAEEVTAFTLEVLEFLKQTRYFDYVLYTTYGVDASTGMRDWQFWYGESFRKEGDRVVFYHAENPDDGGHNLHIPMSRVLGDTLAAYLSIGDATMGLAAEKLCKGMSASMLGMVENEGDDVHHLMARNVVAHSHEFLTHDGKKKAVDYSGWFSTYERWNAFRFPYADNPYWGKVWVTNMRSKDDVPHIFRLVPILRYGAAQAADENVASACGEALSLLEAFAKDIVDSDYRIRSKDEDGDIFIPGYTGDPELDAKQGDLSSFINYRALIPEGECNARRGAELIGYHHAVAEDCGRGEPNAYDDISFSINGYNRRICRYFHLAHLANALVNHDTAAAAQLLSGLEERFDDEKAMPEEQMQYAPDDWWRDVALFLAQSQPFGYPITSDEVRLIHTYYRKGIEKHSAWPYWDPWADSVPEGELGGYRPPNCEGPDDARECWWRVEDMAQIFETCWSPLSNPTSQSYVDCDLVRDPSRWP